MQTVCPGNGLAGEPHPPSGEGEGGLKRGPYDPSSPAPLLEQFSTRPIPTPAPLLCSISDPSRRDPQHVRTAIDVVLRNALLKEEPRDAPPDVPPPK